VVILTGAVSTLAGVPGVSGFADGAVTAVFNYPIGVALSINGTSLFVADKDNHRIREVSLVALPPSPPPLAIDAPDAGPGTFFNVTSNQFEIACDGGGRRLEAAEDELARIPMPARALHASAEPLTSSEVVGSFFAQHPELANRPLGDIDHETLARHFEELSAQLFGQPALA